MTIQPRPFAKSRVQGSLAWFRVSEPVEKTWTGACGVDPWGSVPGTLGPADVLGVKRAVCANRLASCDAVTSRSKSKSRLGRAVCAGCAKFTRTTQGKPAIQCVQCGNTFHAKCAGPHLGVGSLARFQCRSCAGWVPSSRPFAPILPDTPEYQEMQRIALVLEQQRGEEEDGDDDEFLTVSSASSTTKSRFSSLSSSSSSSSSSSLKRARQVLRKEGRVDVGVGSGFGLGIDEALTGLEPSPCNARFSVACLLNIDVM